MGEGNASAGGLDESVHLAEWNSDWGPRAQALANELANLLRPAARIEHIGSTAVKGMRAKPILDMMIGAADDDSLEAYARTLARSGWEDMGEAGVPGRRHMRRRSGHPANLHIVLVTSPHWTNNIALRDYLLAHPAEQTAYGAMKASILANGANRLLSYSQCKAEFMATLLQRAMSWKSAVNNNQLPVAPPRKAQGS
jgi:GrpB-like predicted nucleotidyltransferase (UPF0157 family)